MRLLRFAVMAVAVALLLTLAFLSNATFRDRALTLETPEARLDRLASHWRLVRPDEAEGGAANTLVPVAILLSGCDGPGDSMDFWAATLAEMGWASLVIDSHTPRGLDRRQAWRLVRAGQALSGAERAGDVAVALAALDDMDGVDGSRVALLGASHGAWAAMELVDRLGREAPPPGLSAWPEPREVAAGRLRAAVSLYPYCGQLNGAAEPGLADTSIPTLMVLAGEDTIVSTARCRAAAERPAREVADIWVETLPGVDHGFDQRVHAVFSTLDFDPEARSRAAKLVSNFLTTLPVEPEPVR